MKNVIRLAQILPRRTPDQLTQALKASCWYPSHSPYTKWSPAGIYKSTGKECETGLIKLEFIKT